jgi:hypothetical protein
VRDTGIVLGNTGAVRLGGFDAGTRLVVGGLALDRRVALVLYLYGLIMGVVAIGVGNGKSCWSIVGDSCGPVRPIVGAETTLLLVSRRISGRIRGFWDGSNLGIRSSFKIQ